MWGRLATKLAVYLLRSSRLSNEDRQLLTATMLDRLGALPLRARITVDEAGTILVDGRPTTMEVARHLRESSRNLLKNFSRKFVRDTVTFMAIKEGVHVNLTPEQGLFAKAALWGMQEEDALHRLLAQNSEVEDDE